ncbi:phosphoribosyltransferase [Tanticharoenia sakaeratensis]|uniref:Phosphoribosyltransferase n=1 Tax=Tanticharoenia sakaeratensis NBRC 103193 TaxID=1231623 RepID=A0A0D6MKA9_9PROT|nr:phosphoribosyltransferase [Tanticharoenia sakaeratensis]GAN54109.1 phosphoribosyltransferase [Tanticharoenia sakaeratensis NBRC 103193]GBQ24684.1 phosphoribosyltransferase [Tanticharoenia sakaeratensis NBRC 103193]
MNSYYVTLTSNDTAATPADRHAVILNDGSRLELPLQPLPGGDMAVALLMSNQTSFAVERGLAQRLTAIARAAEPDAIVGVPTMGLSYARPVADALGFADYTALGHSRKFWYDETLSEPVVSITSPGQAKRLYLDPALVERVKGRRVVVVDDVLNTGNTVVAAYRLLQKAGAEIVGIAAVLTEGWDWHAALSAVDPATPKLVHALGHIPMFGRSDAGWTPIARTDRTAHPAR